MPRILRTELPDGVFHVTTKGIDEGVIVLDDVDRRRFLFLIVSAARRFRWTIHAHCLMTTHYHLVLETPRDRLSRGLQFLNGGYARWFNERHGRSGHLFQERFDSRVVDSEAYLEAACDYVVGNPSRAGICEYSREWPWGGYGAPTAEPWSATHEPSSPR